MDSLLPERSAVRGKRAYQEVRDRATPAETARGAVADGLPITPAIGRLKFEDAASDLLTNYQNNKRKSYDDVKYRVEHYLGGWFNGKRLADITTSEVERYTADRLAKGAAAATINRELAALKRMFTLAIRGRKLLYRPYIPLLQEHNTRTGFFERAQFEAVRANLPAALKPIATFAYYTGWRTKSEILTLQWHQVDRDAGTIRLEPGSTKNREGRVFLYAALDDLRQTIDALWAAHEA